MYICAVCEHWYSVCMFTQCVCAFLQCVCLHSVCAFLQYVCLYSIMHFIQCVYICMVSVPGPLPLFPTGMMGYGMAKAAVHQLTKSLSMKDSGMPEDSIALAILP